MLSLLFCEVPTFSIALKLFIAKIEKIVLGALARLCTGIPIAQNLIEKKTP